MKDIIKYKDYYGSIHFDDQSMVFYGKIEFIRALVTYEATDAKGLKQAFKEAVEDYLEMCKNKNIKPELPFAFGCDFPCMQRRYKLGYEEVKY